MLCRAVRELLTSVEALRGTAQQPEVPSAGTASAVPAHSFGSDFGMSTSATVPMKQAGQAKATSSPADPFNMLGTPALAAPPARQAEDTGFADFVGSSTGSKPTHTGYDSLI